MLQRFDGTHGLRMRCKRDGDALCLRNDFFFPRDGARTDVLTDANAFLILLLTI